jgi:hypothetical protein
MPTQEQFKGRFIPVAQEALEQLAIAYSAVPVRPGEALQVPDDLTKLGVTHLPGPRVELAPNLLEPQGRPARPLLSKDLLLLLSASTG